MQIKYYTRYFSFMVPIGIVGFLIVSCSKLGGQYSMYHRPKSSTIVDTKDNSNRKVYGMPDILRSILQHSLLNEVKDSDKEVITTHLNKLYDKLYDTKELLNEDIEKVKLLLDNTNPPMSELPNDSLESSSQSSECSYNSGPIQNDNCLLLYVKLLAHSNILVDLLPITASIKCNKIGPEYTANHVLRYYQAMISGRMQKFVASCLLESDRSRRVS